MFKVRATRCAECLFGPDKIVSDARRKEVLATCAKKDKHFICHKHADVCCRGFFDTGRSTAVQLATRFEKMGFPAITYIAEEEDNATR